MNKELGLTLIVVGTTFILIPIYAYIANKIGHIETLIIIFTPMIISGIILYLL